MTCRRCSDKIREMAKNGQREEAKRLLEELRKMMENATPMMAQPTASSVSRGQRGQQGQGNQQGREMMNQLDRLSRRQNQLLGESEREGRQQQGRQGQQGQRQQGNKVSRASKASRVNKASRASRASRVSGQGQAARRRPVGRAAAWPAGRPARSARRLHEEARRERHGHAGIAGPRRALDARGRGCAAPRRSARGLTLPSAGRSTTCSRAWRDMAEQMRQRGPGNNQDIAEIEERERRSEDRDPLGPLRRQLRRRGRHRRRQGAARARAPAQPRDPRRAAPAAPASSGPRTSSTTSTGCSRRTDAMRLARRLCCRDIMVAGRGAPRWLAAAQARWS